MYVRVCSRVYTCIPKEALRISYIQPTRCEDMYVCMYVYMHVCTCTYACIHAYPRKRNSYALRKRRRYLYKHVRVYLRVHTGTKDEASGIRHVYVCMYISMYACTYVEDTCTKDEAWGISWIVLKFQRHVHTHVHAYIYIYIYIYIYTVNWPYWKCMYSRSLLHTYMYT